MCNNLLSLGTAFTGAFSGSTDSSLGRGLSSLGRGLSSLGRGLSSLGRGLSSLGRLSFHWRSSSSFWRSGLGESGRRGNGSRRGNCRRGVMAVHAHGNRASVVLFVSSGTFASRKRDR